MQTPPSPQATRDALILIIILTAIFIGQAWVNFYKRKLSNFSIDALSLFLAKTISRGKSKQRLNVLMKDPKRIVIFGIFAILGAGSGIYQIIKLSNLLMH
jgi:hypothetical protein